MPKKCRNCKKGYSTKRTDRLKDKYCDECYDAMGLKHLIAFESKYKMEFWDNPL